MIVKYRGVWDVYCSSPELDELINYFKKIKSKNTKASDFCDKQLKLIKEASSFPFRITFVDQGDHLLEVEEDERFINEIKRKKDILCKTLLENAVEACYEGVITEGQHDVLENLIKKCEESC